MNRLGKSIFTGIITAGSFREVLFLRNSCLPKAPPCRSLLSPSYGKSASMNPDFYNDFDKNLGNICMHMDRCNERNLHFSSLALDRMVTYIKHSDDLEAAKYYFYLYRHSNSSYFLRPWTEHVWAEKCIEMNKPDLILEILKTKVQYGLFFNAIINNRMLDTYINENNVEDCYEALVQIFLIEEDFGNILTQKLGLKILNEYYEKKKGDSTNLIDAFKEDITVLRNFGGILFRIGNTLKDSSLTIIGMAILSHIENNHGIRAVYQEPRVPLMWTENYLQRTINNLKSLKEPISTSAFELLQMAAENHSLKLDIDVEKEVLEGKGLISDKITLSAITKQHCQDLSQNEKDDNEMLKTWIMDWSNELKHLYQTEQELLAKQEQQRQEFFKEREIRDRSHKLAVEALGYWDLSKFDEDGELKEADPNEKLLPQHLKKDYVDGSISDIVIESKIQNVLQ